MAKRTLHTKLCDMLGIEYPIICAGMGPTMIGETAGAPVELVVAVSEAGGMGVLGGSGFIVEKLQEAIREIKTKTKKPFGVDLLLPQKLDLGGGLGQKGPKELPLNLMLKSLPKPHQDWVKKIKEELNLPDVEIMVSMNTTTMRSHEAIQVCNEEKVPLFCAGLGNPG